MDRIEIINRLISEFCLDRYLEIGVWRGDCYLRVTCKEKVGVDLFPIYQDGVHAMTSDEFFRTYQGPKFDLVFIDGNHESEQAYRDIRNALGSLSDHGFVVCHDCCPLSEIEQRVPREQDLWTGDVWKAIHSLRVDRDDVSATTFDCDYGCCVISKFPSVAYRPPTKSIDWSYYQSYSKDFLNLKPASYFEQFILNLKDAIAKNLQNRDI